MATREPGDITTASCECEHEAHTGDKHDTHPLHEYMQKFDAQHLVVVDTIYGPYTMCRGCRAEFPERFLKHDPQRFVR